MNEMQEQRSDEDAYQVGAIWNTSWGYDQTNVEFFEVVERKPRSVVLRRLKSAVGDGQYPKVYPATGPDRFTTDYGLMGNSERYNRETGEWEPNPVYVRDEARGYSEKLCMMPRPSKRTGTIYHSLNITQSRTAWPWDGDGEYDTIAAGLPGH